jgi:hypothetical protein
MHLFEEDGKTNRKFANVDVYNRWLKQQKMKMQASYRKRLTPFEYWVTQEKGTERAFTGPYWESQDVGHYECIVCE